MDIRTRVEKIKTTDDAEKQIILAKAYMMRLRTEAKKQSTLSDKLTFQAKIKDAEATMRQMRRLIFDIEDALAEGLPATSVLN